LATAGAASGHRPNTRCEYRADRDSFSGAIGEARTECGPIIDGAIDVRATDHDGTSVAQPATIRDNERAPVTNARTERGALENAGADVRSRRIRRNVGRGCCRCAGLGERIEDGEPLDSDVAIDVRRSDGLTVSKPNRLDSGIGLAVFDTCAFSVDLRDAISFTEFITDSQRNTDAVADTQRVTIADRLNERISESERATD
jgi:hypothetical protein